MKTETEIIIDYEFLSTTLGVLEYQLHYDKIVKEQKNEIN